MKVCSTSRSPLLPQKPTKPTHATRARVRRRSRSRLLRHMYTTEPDAPSCAPTPRRRHSSSGAARAAGAECRRSAAHRLGSRSGRASGQRGRSGSQPADAFLCLCARPVQRGPAAHGSPALCRGVEPSATARRRTQPDLRSRRCVGTRCRCWLRTARPVTAAADPDRVRARRLGHARRLARGVLRLQPAAARTASGCDCRRPHVRHMSMK
jgi:hypothetical protein